MEIAIAAAFVLVGWFVLLPVLRFFPKEVRLLGVYLWLTAFGGIALGRVSGHYLMQAVTTFVAIVGGMIYSTTRPGRRVRQPAQRKS
jgi:hypothetical protein